MHERSSEGEGVGGGEVGKRSAIGAGSTKCQQWMFGPAAPSPILKSSSSRPGRNAGSREPSFPPPRTLSEHLLRAQHLAWGGEFGLIPPPTGGPTPRGLPASHLPGLRI